MKQLLALLTSVAVLAFATSARAEDEEKTIKGQGMCLKCELKKAEKCQNAIKVKEEDGKEVLYELEHNDVSKAFHKNICTSIEKVIATGKVKKEGDKNIFVATKIELDKGSK